MKKSGVGSKAVLWVTASSVAIALAAIGAQIGGVKFPVVGAAFAQTDSGSGDGANGGAGKKKGKDGQVGNGQGDNGQDANGGGNGTGQGGPSADSEGKGPKAGAAGADTRGKPAWAQEGIPEVELGRLNVARSPSKVLDRAYAEALATFNGDMAGFYSLSLENAVMKLSTEFDTASYIDSPLQNLSLLKDALDGSSVLTTLPGVSNTNATLEAIFLGVASDKNVPISVDTVIAITTILGTPVTGDAAAKLAADAEEVRIAVLAGHG
jgi:hypothetical protein